MFQEVFQAFHKTRDFKVAIPHFIDNEENLKELVECITFQREYPFAEYASWLLIHITQANRAIVQPFQKEIVDVVLSGTDNQSVLRNCVNILVQFDLIEYREGELIDRLIVFVKNVENKVALQVYSIHMFLKYLFQYPELKEEFTSIVELYREGRSAAYQAAVINYHKKIKKIK